MTIFRTNNPTEFTEVDQIVIDERAPSPRVRGVSANIAGYVARFERGPTELTEVGSTQQFEELFGRSSASGNQNLKNKRFGRLRIARAVASDAARGSLVLEDDSSNDVLTIEAKWLGVHGNGITVTVEAGSISGKKYTIIDTGANAILPDEVYDNVTIIGKTQEELDQIFGASKLIRVVGETPPAAAEPDNIAATALSGGADGALDDDDYETALLEFQEEKSANVIFADVYTDDIRDHLVDHAAATQDKMVILAGPEVQTVAQVLTDVADYRDTQGRIIYAYPWLGTRISGAEVFQQPASYYASVISQTAPNVDPAFVGNAQFLQAVTKLKTTLSRSDYIQLMEGGVSAFLRDPDVGVRIRSGIVTQILDSEKVTVLRRRMADFLTTSGAFFLKSYQNAVNSSRNRKAAGAALNQFVDGLERDGILPSDDEVLGGLAKIIDVDSLNTDESIAQGIFRILWKQRIFSSMRFIVLTAEIGQSVVVIEGE